MSIYLIRHTVPNLDLGVCCGQSDADVANSFEDDFLNILPTLSMLNIERVYTSPLKRSYRLAEKLANTLQLELKPDDRLKELDFGAWEMQKWENILPTELNLWMVNFVNLRTPKGESYRQMFNRVTDFLNTSDHKNSIIVSHSGVMRSILCALTNTPLNEAFKKFRIDYNEIFEVDINQKSYKKILA